MHKQAIIYLHGFNSASLDSKGRLLVSKAKLAVLQKFCFDHDIQLITPNVDYRDFESLIEDQLLLCNQLMDQGIQVIFMGSSMGGFASEYLAIKTGCPAVMINPVLSPTALLPKFIGVTANYETGVEYHWGQEECQSYAVFEQALRGSTRTVKRLVLLDMADELLNSELTLKHYQVLGRVIGFSGGSHSFEHMQEAIPELEGLLQSL